ncbi:hypothetical protein B0J18DRAFT_127680 [Chaetomium sp. MPI-SDFR-AT-0129]|nr:hypothetical protein B0J18DRAFT_127680 [Chaetomium sp. MPI-SDFR-AT-0129]
MPPRFETRDAAGRRVSLLNDEAPRTSHPLPSLADVQAAQVPRTSPTPATPELLRSSSYDSHMNPTEPVSPLTPLYEPGYGPFPQSQTDHRPRYDEYYQKEAPMQARLKRQPSTLSDGRPVYEDDLIPPPVPRRSNVAPSSGGDRSEKRFPCRFRETLGCEKTFTTSGHASRHAKIHTAEKSVPCTWPGCNKKFTRADNMKQHVETHNKPRSSVSRPAFLNDRRSSSSIQTLPSPTSNHSAPNRSRAIAAGVTKTTTGGRSGRSIKAASMSPTLRNAWDLRVLESGLQPHSPEVDAAAPMPTNLDTLATAALQQIGSSDQQP